MIGRYYFKAKETKKFTISGNGFLSFTINFKYLGSWIFYDLNDSYDESLRIKMVNQAMEAHNFFRQAKKWQTLKMSNIHGYLYSLLL